jgi:hypothetical protein
LAVDKGYQPMFLSLDFPAPEEMVELFVVEIAKELYSEDTSNGQTEG